MSHLINVEQLRELAELEFADIVAEVTVNLNELRIILHEGSFIDVWYSLKLSDRYSYHWERRAINGTIYRYDNAPHQRWRSISTFPHHFHEGQEGNVVESNLDVTTPQTSLRQVLILARQILSNRVARH